MTDGTPPKPGDRDAFAALVAEHQTLVVNACHGFLHNREDAEDAAQQVFLKAWQSLAEFRGESKVSTWLYRIAMRTSFDSLRKRRRAERWHLLLGMLGMSAEPPAVAKDPLVELVDREKAVALMAAIDTLPEAQKAAWVLTTTGGLSGVEAAEVMETSLSAVEALKHRARAGLRKRLREYHESAGLGNAGE